MVQKVRERAIFVCVGSYSNGDDLVYSQMIKMADLVSIQSSIKVESFVVYPLASSIKNWRFVKSDIARLRGRAGHDVHIGFSGIRWSGWTGILFRDLLLRGAVKKLMNIIKAAPAKKITLYCRSYMAAHVSIRAREKLSDKAKLRIIFDTRALLSLEISLIARAGHWFLGKNLEWENYLVRSSDVVVTQSRKALDFLKLLHGDKIDLRFIPIKGLPESCAPRAIQDDLDIRWAAKRIIYVGSLGHWSGLKSVLAAFEQLNYHLGGDVEFVLVTKDRHLENQHRSALKLRWVSSSYDNIHDWYRTSLALVVMGADNTSFLDDLNNRVNYFSTKVVEALSVGTPVIVSPRLDELAHFVEKHRCGMVMDNGSADDFDWLRQCELWKSIFQNSLSAGEQFRRESVEQKFLDLIVDR